MRTFLKQTHSAENVKRRPFVFFKHPICCRIEKLKGDPLETFKIFEKVSQCQVFLVFSGGFVCYVKKRKKYWRPTPTPQGSRIAKCF